MLFSPLLFNLVYVILIYSITTLRRFQLTWVFCLLKVLFMDFNMYVFSKKQQKMILVSKTKIQLQNWLKKFSFSHTITIEPTPSFPFKIEEVQQRLRQIDFNLNRYYFGNNFQKLDSSKRIWMICFNEIQFNSHYNILLHSPFTEPTINQEIKDRFIKEWLDIPSFNPFTQSNRDTSVVPIDINITRNVGESVIYQTKKFDFDNVVDSDNWFFSNPKIKVLEEKYKEAQYDFIMNAIEKINTCRT